MTRIVEGQRHRTEPVKLPSLAARTAWGVIAGLGLCVLLAGVPVLLLVGFGWPPPWPSALAWDYPHLFTDEFLTSALALAAWSAWAWLALIVLREIVRAVRWGIDPAHLRDAASPVRWLAGALIGAVAALWPSAAHTAPPPPAETTTSLGLDHDDLARVADHGQDRPLVWRTDSAAVQTTTAEKQRATAPVANTGSATATDPATGLRVVTVNPENPTLWDMAKKYLGDPTRYMEIYELNKDRDFEGGPFDNPAEINDGWELLIPDTEQTREVDPTTGLRVVTVGPKNPTLWDMAAKHLGDPTRYMEIYELNKDRDFEGGPFDNPAEINDGWQLLIPDTVAPPDESPAGTEAPPAPPDGEGEVYEPPTIDPAVPDDDSTGTEDEEEVTGEPDSTVPQPHASDAGSDREGGNLFAAFPFGVWLSAGTCLAAGTVFAIALRLRRRRTAQREGVPAPVADEVMTGRLSDLEAIIETEARKLAQVVPEPAPRGKAVVPEPVVAVDTNRAPVSLTDLAAAGIGLRGPGQRGAARAAILTAVSAGARVLITEAADLRLELGTAAASDQVRFTVGIDDALETADDGDTLVVCADTDLDEATRRMLELFLTAANRSAFILGDWIPSSLVLEAAGSVKASHGQAADAKLRSLHIADLDTTAAVLASFAAPDTEPEDEVVSEPAAPPTIDGQEDASGTARPSQQEPGQEPVRVLVPLLRLCLFGQPDAYLGDQPVPLKKGRRSRAFLTVLACADGPIGRDELLEGVVGDMVEIGRAKNNFSAVAIDTRRALRDATGDDTAEFYTYDRATETYELERHRFTIDLDEFNDADGAAALATDPAEAAAYRERALALYSADLAPDVDTDAVRLLRDQYRAAAVRLCEQLAEHYAVSGDSVASQHSRDRAAQIAASQAGQIK